MRIVSDLESGTGSINSLLTDVWCKVCDGDGADICGGFDGTDLLGLGRGCVRVLLDEGLVGGDAFVGAVVARGGIGAG